MRIKIFTIIFFVAITTFSFATNTNVYNYDYNNPESIIKSAFLMLKNSDFNAMLEITELYEKKRVLNIISEISNNPSVVPALISEAKKIKSFEIVDREDYTNDATNSFVIVVTKWIVLNDSKSPKNSDIYAGIEDKINPAKSKKDSVVYVDYLLKKIDGKWKIISKRSK
ncbi:MAG: hypothetical protein ACP5QT_03435 [Brevinematia bacterium]